MIGLWCGFCSVTNGHYQALKVPPWTDKDFVYGEPFVRQLKTIEQTEDERNKIRKTLLENVSKTWAAPLPESRKEEAKAIPLQDEALFKQAALIEKVKKIILPKIQFSDLALGQALQMLSDLSEAYDFEGKGVNLLLLDPKKRNPIVSLSLKNLSLYKVIHYLAQAADFDCFFEPDAVVFKKENDLTPLFQTQFFPTSRGTVLQILRHSGESFSEKTKEFGSDEERLLKQFFEKSGISFNLAGAGFVFDGTQIIVSHTSSNLIRIKNILNCYGEIHQVAIEAKFLEVQQGALEEIGLKWRMGQNNRVKVQSGNENVSNLRSLNALQANNPSMGKGSIISNGKEYILENTPPSLPNALNLGLSSVPLVDALTVLNGYEMGLVIQALEQQTDSDLMSAPKLTVLSGKKAEIIVAQELRYPERYGDSHSDVGSNYGSAGSATSSAGVTITAGTPMNFVTRNVGVEMSVTPTVERNHCISLELEPCVTEFEGFVEYGGNHVAVAGGNTVRIPSGFFQPIFSKRQIKTEVTVQNGSTVVMGGLTREEVKETNDRVPFLSNLPILGNLFKSKGHTSQKRNLLIFVTANLLGPDGHFLTKNAEIFPGNR